MKFGTSGLRMLVTEMTDPVCAQYAAAFIAHLGRVGVPRREMLVGRDLRPSSERIAAACRGAITAAGADAVDCGVVPTPALALEAARRGVPAIMVTGSHIPFDRNGLKFYLPSGEIDKADEAGIVDALANPAPPFTGAAGAVVPADITAAYRERVTAFFGPDCLRGLRVGVYQHSAAGRELIGDILAGLGAEITPLGRTDSFVPIDTEAIAPEDAARIAAWVAEHRLDALVSTDGDGDRPLVADETGTVYRGDTVGMLTARFLGADAVATPISSSTALERSGWFERIARTRIGSPYVIEGIARLKAAGARLAVGYEANGGFLLGGTAVAPGGARLAELPTRDAMVPIAALLAMAAGKRIGLSGLARLFPARVTASSRLERVPIPSGARLLAALAADAGARGALLADLGAGGVAAVDTLDGVRMTLDSGDIVHLRMSGNAPELRCYAEAGDSDRAAWLVARLLERVAPLLRDGGDPAAA